MKVPSLKLKHLVSQILKYYLVLIYVTNGVHAGTTDAQIVTAKNSIPIPNF